MIKLKVTRKHTKLFYIISILICIILAGLFLYCAIKDTRVIYSDRGTFYMLMIVSLAFIPIICFLGIDNKVYVSDIYISNEDIGIIYKSGKNIVKNLLISKNDIKSFFADANINYYRVDRFIYVGCNMNIMIRKTNNKLVQIVSETSNSGLNFNIPYSLILDLIKYSNLIPNFSYKVEGNCQYAVKDINHYALTGKRLPLIKRLFNDIIFISFLIVCIILAILWMFVFIF